MADVKSTHANLTKALEKHHAELADLSSQIAKLDQQKAILKASVAAQLHIEAEQLGIPREAIGNLVAGCL